MTTPWPVGALPPQYFTPQPGPFTDFLAQVAALPVAAPGAQDLLHGTTVIGLNCVDGVVIAGDRRATMGTVIASHDIQKVFITDEHSAVGIAGTAGVAIELVRLFALELEHYEKIEGIRLSLDGKANRLAALIRGNLSAALGGLAVLPLLVGYDTTQTDPAKAGRIYSYDITGGRYEERDYHCIGSGAVWAKSALKKRFDPTAGVTEAVRQAVGALFDAADDDSATAGPDIGRRIYPVVVSIDASGARRWPDTDIAELAQQIVIQRQVQP